MHHHDGPHAGTAQGRTVKYPGYGDIRGIHGISLRPWRIASGGPFSLCNSAFEAPRGLQIAVRNRGTAGAFAIEGKALSEQAEKARLHGSRPAIHIGPHQ